MRTPFRPTSIVVYLTPVEAEIVCMVAQGMTNKAIGEAMHYRGDAENCAKTQVCVALRKLGLPHRTALALWAHGLWPAPRLDANEVLRRSAHFKASE